MKKPLISVIIPCFNAEKYVEVAVRSACQQQGIDIEVIAVDDGSTDNTARVLTGLEQEFPQLRTISYASNKGQAFAKNYGFKAARGTYLAILDSDDYYVSENSLQLALAASREGKAEVIICDYLRKVPLMPSKRIGPTGQNVQDLLYVLNWQLIIKRDFLLTHAIEFLNETPQREDFPFVLQVLLNSKSKSFSNHPLLVHVLRPGSTMRSQLDDAQLVYFARNMIHVNNILKRGIGPADGDILKRVSIRYLNQTLTYWAGALLVRLGENQTPSGIQVVKSYLEALHQLTQDVPSLSTPEKNVHALQDPNLYTGNFDLLRLIAEAQDVGLLEQLLSGHRIHYSRLLALSKQSAHQWAENAVTSHIRFSQSAIFPEETPTTLPLSSMVKKVVLHIGYPKTGSSAIQLWMEENRFKLLEHGVWYPIFGVKREGGLRFNRTSGHSYLVRQLVKKKTAKRALQLLANELAALPRPVEKLFLSSEMILSHHFWQKPRRHVQKHVINKVVAAFKPADIEVVFFVRPPLEWAEAYYKEIVSNPANGYAASFVDFAKELHKRGLLNPEGILEFLESQIGINRVTMLPYQDARVSSGSIPLMLDTLNVNSSGFSWKHATANASLPDSFVSLLRRAKSLGYRQAHLNSFYLDLVAGKLNTDDSLPLITNEERLKVTRLVETRRKSWPVGSSSDRRLTHTRSLELSSEGPQERQKTFLERLMLFRASTLRRVRTFPLFSLLRGLKRVSQRIIKRLFFFLSASSYRGGKLALMSIRHKKWDFSRPRGPLRLIELFVPRYRF